MEFLFINGGNNCLIGEMIIHSFCIILVLLLPFTCFFLIVSENTEEDSFVFQSSLLVIVANENENHLFTSIVFVAQVSCFTCIDIEMNTSIYYSIILSLRGILIVHFVGLL